jgi:hypothetical protein
MSRAGQRARLDRLLELIGPKIQRIRVEGAGTAEELSGPEPPFIVDEVTGRRIYVSPTTAAMIKGGGLAAADAAKSPTSPNPPPRAPTHAELVQACREEARNKAVQAAARAAAGAAAKPKP